MKDDRRTGLNDGDAEIAVKAASNGMLEVQFSQPAPEKIRRLPSASALT